MECLTHVLYCVDSYPGSYEHNPKDRDYDRNPSWIPIDPDGEISGKLVNGNYSKKKLKRFIKKSDWSETKLMAALMKLYTTMSDYEYAHFKSIEEPWVDRPEIHVQLDSDMPSRPEISWNILLNTPGTYLELLPKEIIHMIGQYCCPIMYADFSKPELRLYCHTNSNILLETHEIVISYQSNDKVGPYSWEFFVSKPAGRDESKQITLSKHDCPSEWFKPRYLNIQIFGNSVVMKYLSNIWIIDMNQLVYIHKSCYDNTKIAYSGHLLVRGSCRYPFGEKKYRTIDNTNDVLFYPNGEIHNNKICNYNGFVTYSKRDKHHFVSNTPEKIISIISHVKELQKSFIPFWVDQNMNKLCILHPTSFEKIGILPIKIPDHCTNIYICSSNNAIYITASTRNHSNTYIVTYPVKYEPTILLRAK